MTGYDKQRSETGNSGSPRSCITCNDIDRLRAAYVAARRDAAAGIDGETWQHYGEHLETHLQDLARRLQRGAYRAKLVRRAYIPKADGRLRPLGVPTVEDKIVQRGRSPHHALDALSVGLLANIYLHYVFDLWVHHWRKRQARGDVVVVRFADDFVGFEHREDAEQCLAALRERFARFGLTLHPEKTRLLEFGRFAAANRRARGAGKPESFHFLGFTHSCARTRKGSFTVLRRTMRVRWQAKLKAVKAELRQRMHHPLPDLGAYVRAVIMGHTRYYGVPMNGPAICAFAYAVRRLWWRTFARRSQRRLPWSRMQQHCARWIPPIRICHPYPLVRFGVVTQGGSRMR